MNKKYELTKEIGAMINDTVLHRIRALVDFGDVKAGDMGGFIEKEENLSHDGDAWVYGDACVCGDARVYGDACVSGDARVCGNARVYGDAWVYGDACVSGNACVSGDARVCGNARVYGDACVSGNARVYGDACVCGNAQIYSDADYLCFKGLGSKNRNVTFFECQDGHIYVLCGCFNGDLSAFEQKVRDTHGDSKYAREYLSCIEVVKIHFENSKKENDKI